MKLDATNRWLTLGANLGVIVGLVFLALQIRQSTEVTRSAVDLDIAALGTEFHMRIAENPGLAQAYYVGMRAPDTLTEEQRVQLHYLIPGLFLFLEGAHRQYRRGFLSESGWAPYEELIAALMDNTVVRQWWEEGGTVFSREFVSEVESITGIERP